MIFSPAPAKVALTLAVNPSILDDIEATGLTGRPIDRNMGVHAFQVAVLRAAEHENHNAHKKQPQLLAV